MNVNILNDFIREVRKEYPTGQFSFYLTNCRELVVEGTKIHLTKQYKNIFYQYLPASGILVFSEEKENV